MQEQCLSEVQGAEEEDKTRTGVERFGEDYARFLRNRENSSSGESFDENVRNKRKRRRKTDCKLVRSELVSSFDIGLGIKQITGENIIKVDMGFEEDTPVRTGGGSIDKKRTVGENLERVLMIVEKFKNLHCQKAE